MDNAPKIRVKQLMSCLQEQYALKFAFIDFLPLGLDYSASVYRAVSESGTPYLVKAKSGVLYEPSFFVPSYLRNKGIASVVAPTLTKDNSLWTQLENWTVIVYPFIDGDSSWSGMKEVHWERVGNTFNKVHNTIFEPDILDLLKKETFNVTKYVERIRDFEVQHIQKQIIENTPEQVLCSVWLMNQSKINKSIDFLKRLASQLQKRTLSFVVCHADLHPANVLRDSVGNVFVVDWDEVMMAPKERDFIFLNETSFYGLESNSITSFLKGYGPTEIDWVILTYYKLERAIQDLIEYTEQIFFRNDSVGEKTKSNAIQAIIELFEDGGEIAAAYSVAKYIPLDNILNME